MMTWFGKCVASSLRLSMHTRVPWLMACTIALAIVTSSSHGAAQAQKRRLLLLENTSSNVPEPLQKRVDRALRDAADRHGAVALEPSPLPFEDIAMAAGCGDRGDACGARIVATLDDDALLVRELELSEAGVLMVRLVAHERGSGEARAVEANLGLDGPNSPELAMPRLIAQLYGPPERTEATPTPPVAAEPVVQPAKPKQPVGDTVVVEATPSPKQDVSSGTEKSLPLRTLGWSLTAVGVGLLTAAVAVGSLSKREHREYADVDIEQRDDVDRALPHLDRAQQRARQANGLLAGGAAAAAAGVGVLLYEYLRGKDQKPSTTSFLIAPDTRGVAFSLRGSFSPL